MSDFLSRAKDYCQSRSIQLDEKKQLGYGTDGGVWRTNRDSAIKVFERLYNYDDELECYRRFTDCGTILRIVIHDSESRETLT